MPVPQQTEPHENVCVWTSLTGKPRVHMYTTFTDNYKVPQWMADNVARSDTNKLVKWKRVPVPPQSFKSRSIANIMRIKNLCINRENISSSAQSSGRESGNQMSVSGVTRIRKRRSCTKSLWGRGSECAPWLQALEADLTTDLDRLCKLKSMVFVDTLITVSNNMLCDSTNDDYHKDMRYGKCDKLTVELIITDLIRRLMCCPNILLRP